MGKPPVTLINVSDNDRKGLEQWKEAMAKIRANAEFEMKKRMRSMTAGERTKLKRLLTNTKFLGDVGKAAGRSRVSRVMLDKWMNMPGVSYSINNALNEAKAMKAGGPETAEGLLFRSKVAPELEKDAEIFRVTGQRNRESRVIAKFAAADLKGHRWQIVQAANNNDKHFFIDLAKCLTGEIKPELYDKLDHDIAEICCRSPEIRAGFAVAELAARGHKITVEAFRVRKKRLGLSKPRVRKK